jgi:DtxR family Mn-dependent transcriptional regulator
LTTTTTTFSSSIEDYLETIFVLVRDRTVARSKEIAERLGVTPASVTGMLQTLRERGLVYYEPYGSVTLTDEGTKVARQVNRRHEVLRGFLIDVLSVNIAEAEVAACNMEHGISKHVIDRFIAFAEFIKTCPRGGAELIGAFARNHIPAETAPEECVTCMARCLDEFKAAHTATENKGEEPVAMTIQLSSLKPGERGEIVKLEGSGAVKRRIRDMGVTSGSVIEVIRVAPFGDPIDIKVKNYHLSLRKVEATDIIVRRVDNE